jgi:hypothetical protein
LGPHIEHCENKCRRIITEKSNIILYNYSKW